jgi:hypothetical protein
MHFVDSATGAELSAFFCGPFLGRKDSLKILDFGRRPFPACFWSFGVCVGRRCRLFLEIPVVARFVGLVVRVSNLSNLIRCDLELTGRHGFRPEARLTLSLLTIFETVLGPRGRVRESPGSFSS